MRARAYARVYSCVCVCVFVRVCVCVCVWWGRAAIVWRIGRGQLLSILNLARGQRTIKLGPE